MLAIVFDGKPILRRDYPKPRPAKDEALVEVLTAGVCKTDLEIIKGYMSFSGVMGHEFVGRVIAGPRKWKNRRVVSEINCLCKQCDMCKSGLSNHCRNRTVLGIDGHDGVFAEYVVVPVRNLHEVPAAISNAEAVFVEPLAAAFQVIKQVKFDSADRVVVLGDGQLGQLVARVLKLTSVRPLLVGKYPWKLDTAEKQGIQTSLVSEFVTRGDFDVVVDATGSPDGFTLAMQAVRPRGTIVLKSTFATDTGLNLAPLVVNEVRVVGSRCGPFPDALRALAKKKVDLAALLSRSFPLSDGLAALQAAAAGDRIKVLIDVRE